MEKFEFKHRYVPTVPQVRYSSWYDKTAPENYWNDISSIAEILGYMLEGSITGFGGRRRQRVSTISVGQVKEKFGSIRAYCTLASEELVNEKWENDPRAEGTTGPTDEYKQKCLEDDAVWYRHTYQTLTKLLPHYHSAITDAADYPGLLCETKEELDELLDSPYHSGAGVASKTPEDRQKLYKICGFDKKV